tara:strand:- start:18 stop:251 length:234 start_codon:yes stop_codon:yes gene_type:complete
MGYVFHTYAGQTYVLELNEQGGIDFITGKVVRHADPDERNKNNVLQVGNTWSVLTGFDYTLESRIASHYLQSKRTKR